MLLTNVGEDNGIAVDRATLADRAADMLRELILTEKLVPEEILAERELSKMLGISRTPLREALRVLAAEGLVEMTPNFRPKVANPSLNQLLDLIDVLSSLERLSCEMTTRRNSEALVEKLEQQIAIMKLLLDDGDDLEFFKCDMEFHNTIVASTGNQPLIITHRQYNAALFRARFMSTQLLARRPLMHEQHSAICGLIKSGDGVAAGSLMNSHLQQLKINLTELFGVREGP